MQKNLKKAKAKILLSDEFYQRYGYTWDWVRALVGALHANAGPTLPFLCLAARHRSPSLTSSFLTAFSRAARRGGRTPMILTCRAPPKYSWCVVEPQADGRGSLGVSRRLPFEVAFWA